MALSINLKFQRKLTSAFKNDVENFANFQRLKDNGFILDRKMAELNQNKNSKQPDRPSAVCKLYRENTLIAQLTKPFN